MQSFIRHIFIMMEKGQDQNLNSISESVHLLYMWVMDI
jgi:hypothetical protein